WPPAARGSPASAGCPPCPPAGRRRRRLYDAAMVERLARLHRLVDRGHRIGQLAALDDAALDALLEERRSAGYGGVDGLPERMLDAVAEYRVDVFDRELSVAIATLPLSVLIARVVAPLLREVGMRWADGRLAIAQERLVSSLLRARLLSVLDQHPGERAPRVLFATLPGEGHELGLIGAALHARDAGVPLLYLGTELPAKELARVAGRLGAAGVAVSSVVPAHARRGLVAAVPGHRAAGRGAGARGQAPGRRGGGRELGGSCAGAARPGRTAPARRGAGAGRAGVAGRRERPLPGRGAGAGADPRGHRARAAGAAGAPAGL